MMAGTRDPAAPVSRMDPARGADALRDSLAAIRCGLAADREGMQAIICGTGAPRLALGMLAAITAIITVRTGVSLEPLADGSGPVTEAVRVVECCLASDSADLHAALTTMASPRDCFVLVALLAAFAIDRGGVTPAGLDEIGRSAIDFMLDLPREPGEPNG